MEDMAKSSGQVGRWLVINSEQITRLHTTGAYQRLPEHCKHQSLVPNRIVASMSISCATPCLCPCSHDQDKR